MASNLLGDVIDDYRKRALLAAFSFKDLMYRLLAFILTTSFILWLSVFIYVSFYYSYVPAISHIRPVHLEYSTCADNAGLCSNPSANVTLTNQRSLLQKNQPYNIILDLELPESEANKQLGMFMVKLKLTGRDGKLISESRRSAMLRYKSWILHLLSTTIFSPALIAGPMEEKQWLKVEMFSEFLEHPDNPVTNVKIEIESRWLQLYSAKLRIQAEFTGLRYFMFHWPVVSATIGIATHVILLSFLIGYVWYRILNPNQVVVRVGLGLNRSGNSSAVLSSASSSPTLIAGVQSNVATVEPQLQFDTQNKTLEQRRMEAREILLRERQRQLQKSPSRSRSASFSTPQPFMERSPSFSTPPRVQELPTLTPSRIMELISTPTPPPLRSAEEKEGQDKGLVMFTDTSPELRRRSSSIVGKEALKDY